MNSQQIIRLKILRDQVIDMAIKLNSKEIKDSINDLNLLSDIEQAFNLAIKNHTKE